MDNLQKLTYEYKHATTLHNFFCNFIHRSIGVNIFLKVKARVTLSTIHINRCFEKPEYMFTILGIKYGARTNQTNKMIKHRFDKNYNKNRTAIFKSIKQSCNTHTKMFAVVKKKI